MGRKTGQNTAQLDLFNDADFTQTTDTIRPDGGEALAGVSARDDGGSRSEGRASGSTSRSAGADQGRAGRSLSEAAEARADGTTSRQPGLGDGAGTIPTPSAGTGGELDFSSAAANYRITGADELETSSLSTKYVNNVAAIRTLRMLEEHAGAVSESAKQNLVRYSGWGGLPQVFGYKDDSKWNAKRDTLRELLTDEEYVAARTSTLNSHYTSPIVIGGMYEALDRLGFKGGKILEPACGVGHFLGTMPESMAEKSHVTGVEMDAMSAKIAEALYPQSKIHHSPFEKTKLPREHFDLAVSNVPFGNYPVHDPRFNDQKFSVHDYFFAASLDHVRPGGLVAFITSHYSLDKANSSAREFLSDRAEFLGAIRLPSNAFEGMAQTQVTTDIIFLQKLEEGQSAKNRSWENLAMSFDSNNRELMINEHFYDHPEMMLGKMVTLDRGMYGQNEPSLAPDGRDLGEALREAIKGLPQQIYKPSTAQVVQMFGDDEQEEVPLELKENSFHVRKDGSIAVHIEAELRTVEGLAEKTKKRIQGMVKVREAARGCLQTQVADDTENILPTREALNTEYDRFVRANGPINLPVNVRCFRDDPDSALLRSLENYDETSKTAKKTAIFSERTISPSKAVTSVETPQEALLVSLNETGRVDMQMIGKLLRQDFEDFLPELKGAVYNNPETNQWETDDEYLSGNVRQKLSVAQLYSVSNPTLIENVEALEAVQPIDLKASEIDARLGSTWIPPADVSRFVQELLEVPQDQASVAYSPLIGTWNIEAGFAARRGLTATSNWGTERCPAIRLIDDALNLRIPTIRDTDSEGNSRVNVKETEAARAKQSEIKEHFSKWIWQDDDRRERLVEKYNLEMNNTRLRTFNGDHLTLPGITSGVTLRPHQKAAVWRTLQSKNTLLAHVVGAGKTYTMVAAAMEMKRLGISQKPMIVVPNHMLGQFSAELLQLYPNANILVAGKEDFHKSKRAELFGRISTGNWDAVIVTHSGFERIPMSEEATRKHITTQVTEMENAIIEQRAESSNNRLVKDLEKMKQRLETKLEELSAGGKKDNTLTFEELGVDRLFVDEAHYYKNLQFTTKMTRVAGLPNTSSQRAFDLYLKTRYVQEKENGGVVFATATPIANSVAEMFTMQRYLQPETLAEKGIAHFDSWAGTFGETVTAMELSPDGSGYRVNTRFARFINVPELMGTFREVADVQTAEMLNLPIPKLHEGKAQIVSAPQSDELNSIVSSLAARAQSLRNGSVDPRDDNMLKITTEGRKAALDLRVLDTDYPDIPDSKINLTVQNVHQIWQDTAENKSTQMIFCDLSRPGAKEGQFSVYDELRSKLEAKGIPSNEIEFIHSHEKDAAKLALFKKLRSGEVRILLGSTQKMGTGTNAQRLLCALHHLDAPWRPADIEQREGRILRQGNLNPEVKIMRYVTEGSFDGYMWQTLETKARFISQVMSGDTTVRSIEDLDSPALSYAEVKAIASGNPLVLEKAKVDADVMRLSVLKSQHQDSHFRVRSEIRAIERRTPKLEERSGKMIADSANIIDTKGDKFRIELNHQLITDRKVAGSKIQSAIARNASEKEPVTLGKFGNFTIETVPGKLNEVVLKGNLRYHANVSESPTGTISSVERVFDSIARHLEDLRTELHEDHHRLEGLKKISGKDFEHQPQLDELLQKQKELTEKLTVDQEPIEVSTDDKDEAVKIDAPQKAAAI